MLLSPSFGSPQAPTSKCEHPFAGLLLSLSTASFRVASHHFVTSFLASGTSAHLLLRLSLCLLLSRACLLSLSPGNLVIFSICAVSFVGSTPVAKYIYEQSAMYGKRVQALGGAKNHLVVMPDANLAQAVDGIIGAGYGSAGERCMAVSVAVAVGEIADELVDRIHIESQKLKVAPWTDPDSDMGPVISKDHKEKIQKYIEIGVKEGAKLIEDGRNYNIQGYENGYFIGPTLFDEVTKEMQIYKEEGKGTLNSEWVEWLMGYPIGWTDIGSENQRESQELGQDKQTECKDSKDSETL